MNNNEDDRLEVVVYANGVIRVSGIGRQYQEFYKWKRSLMYSNDIKLSWPHEYFIINRENEFKELFSKFRKYITFSDIDYSF